MNIDIPGSPGVYPRTQCAILVPPLKGIERISGFVVSNLVATVSKEVEWRHPEEDTLIIGNLVKRAVGRKGLFRQAQRN